MITGRQNTLAWLQALTDLNFPYWTIYWKGKTDSGHFVFKSSQDEGLTMTDSLNDLRRKLDMLGYGQYTIIAQSKSGNIGKGAAKEDFELTAHEAPHALQSPAIGSVQVSAPMSGYITEEKAMELAEKKFKELVLTKENEDLKKEIAQLRKDKTDLEKEAESGTTRIINMVAGIVEPMFKPAVAQVGTLGMPAPAQPAASPVIENAEVITGEPTQEQIEMANRLQKVLAECEQIFGEPAVPFLEKLMEKVRAQPFMVSMVKNALK